MRLAQRCSRCTGSTRCRSPGHWFRDGFETVVRCTQKQLDTPWRCEILGVSPSPSVTSGPILTLGSRFGPEVGKPLASRSLERERWKQMVTPSGDISDSKFLTVAEVASMMRVSKMTVYRLVHSGELPAVRVGRSFRVREDDANEYLKSSFYNAG
ncbi:helix-turn-helix domain-containing protein [Nocardioides sp. CCNWLW239]|uniref:helix-turn-helix domain-containing protein n=1 Tax=Nocardioides sp. CCNWLW239 TaxID=3128902 RepID=UPI003FA57284